jgi:hypothetical protein
MTNLLECGARAALCRQLAQREPDSKDLWLAEAERWLRLTQEPGLRGAAPDGGSARTWCLKTIRKRKNVQHEFWNTPIAADSEAFEELSSGLSLEIAEPH